MEAIQTERCKNYEYDCRDQQTLQEIEQWELSHYARSKDALDAQATIVLPICAIGTAGKNAFVNLSGDY